MPDTNLLPLSGSQGVSSYIMSLSQLELTYRRALASLSLLVAWHRMVQVGLIHAWNVAQQSEPM